MLLFLSLFDTFSFLIGCQQHIFKMLEQNCTCLSYTISTFQVFLRFCCGIYIS